MSCSDCSVQEEKFTDYSYSVGMSGVPAQAGFDDSVGEIIGPLSVKAAFYDSSQHLADFSWSLR